MQRILWLILVAASFLHAHDTVRNLYSLHTQLDTLSEHIEEAVPTMSLEDYHNFTETLRSAGFEKLGSMLENFITFILEQTQTEKNIHKLPIMRLLADERMRNSILYGDPQGKPKQFTDHVRSYHAQCVLLFRFALNYTMKHFQQVQKQARNTLELNVETFFDYVRKKGWWKYIREKAQDDMDTSALNCFDELIRDMPQHPSPILQAILAQAFEDLQKEDMLPQFTCLEYRALSLAIQSLDKKKSPITRRTIKETEEDLDDIRDSIATQNLVPRRKATRILHDLQNETTAAINAQSVHLWDHWSLKLSHRLSIRLRETRPQL